MSPVTSPGVPRLHLTAVLALSLAVSACNFGVPAAPAKPAPPPTSTPKVGGQVFGVTCDPTPLAMLHGETKDVALSDIGNVGRVTEFRIGTVTGTANDVDASEVQLTQNPAPGGSGWSSLPGTIQVASTAVDGPARTETYLINILLGGGQGTGQITGGNLWCQLNVEHVVTPTPTPSVTPTPTATPTPTPTPTATPKYVITGPGFQIWYTGQEQAQTSGTLEASAQVIGDNGEPGQGPFSFSLGDPPTDPRATHASGSLDSEGKITAILEVNWPAGTTKLYCSFNGQVYELAEITITP